MNSVWNMAPLENTVIDGKGSKDCENYRISQDPHGNSVCGEASPG